MGLHCPKWTQRIIWRCRWTHGSCLKQVLCGNWAFLEQETLLLVIHRHLLHELLQCTLHGTTLEHYLEAAAIWNVVDWAVLSVPGVAHVTPLLHKLHWVPVYFRAKFKMLVITFKVLHSIGPGYLRNHLIPITSISLSESVREEGWTGYGLISWQGQGRDPLFLLSLHFEASCPISQQPSFFWKSIKSWLCQLAWGSNSGMQPWRWMVVWGHLLHLFNFGIF